MRRVTLLKRPRVRMLFRQKELLRWLGVSIFEIWVWLVSLTVFSVLLVLKIEVGSGNCDIHQWTSFLQYSEQTKTND